MRFKNCCLLAIICMIAGGCASDGDGDGILSETGELVGSIGSLLPGEAGQKARQAERVSKNLEHVNEEASDLADHVQLPDENAGKDQDSSIKMGDLNPHAKKELGVLWQNGHRISAGEFEAVQEQVKSAARDRNKTLSRSQIAQAARLYIERNPQKFK